MDLWGEVIDAWAIIEEQVWEALDLPVPSGYQARVIDELTEATWGDEEWRLFEALADRFDRELMGETQNPAHYADTANADAVIAKANRTSFVVGVDRATQLTERGEAALLGTRQELAQRKLLEEGFDRLSDNGRMRLSGILRNETYPGGSVRGILQDAMAEGENPIATARTLSTRFSAYRDWEFARLARTEVAFAQQRGMREEWTAEGYTVPLATEDDTDHGIVAGSNFPHSPFHPNCVCSEIPDPETGLLIPDIADTACSFCLAIRDRLFGMLSQMHPEAYTVEEVAAESEGEPTTDSSPDNERE